MDRLIVWQIYRKIAAEAVVAKKRNDPSDRVLHAMMPSKPDEFNRHKIEAILMIIVPFCLNRCWKAARSR
jgi:hypothetical protein